MYLTNDFCSKNILAFKNMRVLFNLRKCLSWWSFWLIVFCIFYNLKEVCFGMNMFIWNNARGVNDFVVTKKCFPKWSVAFYSVQYNTMKLYLKDYILCWICYRIQNYNNFQLIKYKLQSNTKCLSELCLLLVHYLYITDGNNDSYEATHSSDLPKRCF